MNGRSSTRLQLALAADSAAARHARRFVASVLPAALPAPVVANVRLIVGELVSNASQHGHLGDEVTVVVDLSDDAHIELEVTGGRSSAAVLADPAGWTIAGPGDESGRGLGIVGALADEVRTDTRDGMVVVRCRLHR